MAGRALGWVGFSVAIIAACSGKAVVDPPSSTSSGSGGATSTSSGTTSTTSSGTTTSTTSSGTGGTAPTCSSLEADLEDAWIAARRCNPSIDVDQCVGEMVYDTCGCEWVSNAMFPELAAFAVEAYDVWVDHGCGPYDCAWCPPPMPAICEPDSGGNTGICVPLAN
jgi:hypothetical protein